MNRIKKFFSKNLSLFILAVPIVIAGFGIYYCLNTLNPDSRFCSYRIYQQPDGTYQVWWVGRTAHLELLGATYEKAKAFQIKECQDLKDFINNSPKGKRVK